MVAVAQPPCAPYDVGGNAAAHAAVIRSADARVVVFPEMSLTGYHFDAPPIAADDRRLTPIVDACAQVGAVALVGAPGSTGEGYDQAAGRSGIWRPGGVVHTQAGPEVGTITRATLSPSPANDDGS